jgi:hypothetical protein
MLPLSQLCENTASRKCDYGAALVMLVRIGVR